MATYVKLPFSASTNGRGILVGATDPTAGTTIHTAYAHVTNPDVATVYAYNSDSSAVVLTLLWGGTTDPDDRIKMSIPAQSGLSLVVPDLIVRNSLVVKAAAATASKIVLYGYVNRIVE